MNRRWALAGVMASAMPPSAHARSPRVTSIEFPSDGFTVCGRFFATGSDPLATLILLPGSDFDPTDVLDLGRLLSDRDVNVMTFAARGTHGSDGRFTFTSAADDVAAALKWLAGGGGEAVNVDPERVAIGGHSLGGGIAMAFAGSSREQMASDIRDWLARRLPR